MIYDSIYILEESMKLYLIILLSIVTIQSQATEDRMLLPVMGIIKPEDDITHVAIALRVGQTFDASFNALPLCGLSWYLETPENDHIIVIKEKCIVEDTHRDPHLVGGQVREWQTFTLKAMSPGRVTLCFKTATRTKARYYHIEIE